MTSRTTTGEYPIVESSRTTEHQAVHAHPRRDAFLEGVKTMLPFIIAIMPFAVMVSALMIQAGMSPISTLAISMGVFAGSIQLVSAGLIAQGTSLGLLALTAFIINLRMSLYAASLAPVTRHLSQRWLLPLGALLTDGSFAFSIGRYNEGRPYTEWYHLGLSLTMYVWWQICAVIGIIAGTQLSGLIEFGFDFVTVGTVAAIVIPMIKTRPELIVAIGAGVLSLLTYNFPHQTGLLFTLILSLIIGALADQFLGGEE